MGGLWVTYQSYKRIPIERDAIEKSAVIGLSLGQSFSILLHTKLTRHR